MGIRWALDERRGRRKRKRRGAIFVPSLTFQTSILI